MYRHCICHTSPYMPKKLLRIRNFSRDAIKGANAKSLKENHSHQDSTLMEKRKRSHVHLLDV